MHTAPWVATANLVGIRFCDIHPATVGWFGGTASEARALITTALMQIEGLAVAPGFDWVTLRASVRVEGDFTCANGLWTTGTLDLATTDGRPAPDCGCVCGTRAALDLRGSGARCEDRVGAQDPGSAARP